MLLILAITGVPVLGTLLAVVSTIHPDLSNLVPRGPAEDGRRLLDWSALQHGDVSPAAPVQALGYMAETDRSIRAGDWVRIFVLLPEAGNLLHPAHRLGNQMIEVQLRGVESIQFSAGSLVWVRGILQSVPGDPARFEPLYRLQEAHVELADKGHIQRYFR